MSNRVGLDSRSPPGSYTTPPHLPRILPEPYDREEIEAVTHSLRLSEPTTEATTQTVATASTTRTKLAA
ncbi:hypothetical protein BH23ACT1_BH23ACT1_13270 [soil metagenome]